ncbi:ECF transporter S component [Caldibacillus lycopersici]|uniref:Riboflavin transporter n=1 Tax=Perspicuibacillus lycopersici TaxID=1325689 RepID=A0AAE3ISN6_9BACI|nr:ECF transporter S component [Perspicuibacillus lycopersici]MCU9613741.1 ECF transporter S component [Perspicuibacillus lycopersici]
MKKLNIKAFVSIGMLSAVAFVLMLLDFPLPMFPSFLKIDFSDIPALIAAIIMGPMAGVLVELFKNLLDLLTTGSVTGIPVGHIANFVTGVIFILPTYYIYKKIKSQKGLTIALIAGTLITAIMMSVLNYFVFLPMYAVFMNYEVPSEWVVSFILPFNILKGIMMSIVFLILFVKMQNWISKQQSSFNRL